MARVGQSCSKRGAREARRPTARQRLTLRRKSTFGPRQEELTEKARETHRDAQSESVITSRKEKKKEIALVVPSKAAMHRLHYSYSNDLHLQQEEADTVVCPQCQWFVALPRQCEFASLVL